MSSDLSAPPVLSTPAEHTFLEDPTPSSTITKTNRLERSDDELFKVYEIARTAVEILRQDWSRIALQFPDAMLPDAPWVVNALNQELGKLTDTGDSVAEETEQNVGAVEVGQRKQRQRQRLYILADTSYSACCVDEIAAEHAEADAVVHYGRACLSPTARLPVLHIFTAQELDHDAVADMFAQEFADRATKAIIMADVIFQEHVAPVCALLKNKGYGNVVGTEIIRDPSSTIPNRSIPSISPVSTGKHDYDIHEYHLFHISTPPTSLLLTLSSRVASLRIHCTPSTPYTTTPPSSFPDSSSTPAMLRRRYGLVTRFATASIIGILVNTLSVKNYMSTIDTLRNQIAAAGKKSYTIVVGKLNAAKLANFAEIDGWVVVGCWESGLVDQDCLWKPVVTPFELGLALQSDESRVWTGEWWGGIEGVENEFKSDDDPGDLQRTVETGMPEDAEDGVDDEESEPPVFDLRTGKLVSNTRPMRVAIRSSTSAVNRAQSNSGVTVSQTDGSALVKRATGEIALINGVASPGAEFLRSKRTWQGLGSDFKPGEDESSTVVEEGRSGVARGYIVGEQQTRS
ncbi:putative diphthamide synthesis protein-domain-containing protein [Xylariaceae sp. FL1651]|nr:putative diphthamide synthesis protein-domain-containing protein [Xylariaceae sp. FL1651]